MDAFESLVAMLLRRDGWWTVQGFKVELTKEEKRRIDRPSSPRWEIDVLAYRGSTNEVLAVECKSYLDSYGVRFRDGVFHPAERYKLFSDGALRRTVLRRLAKQLQERRLVAAAPCVRLGLAIGRRDSRTDPDALRAHFDANGWDLFDQAWIRRCLRTASESPYDDDIAVITAKLIEKNELE